jgi:hypothetical protein
VAGTAVPGRIRVLAVLVSTFAAFALPTTIGAASAQQRSELRPAHASASGSQETVSASSRVESSPGSRAGHRSQDPRSPHRGDRHDAQPGQRGNGRSPSTSNEPADGGTGTEGRGNTKDGGKDDGKAPKQEKQPKKDEEPKQEKTTGPPPGQRGSGASDRARERANPASPVGAPPAAEPTPAPAPAPSVGTRPPARVPTVPLPEADRQTRTPAPASVAPPASPATPSTPVAVPAAGSDQATTLAFIGVPATAEPPATPTSPEPPADLLGDVELPLGSGDADRFGALGRSALDAILDGAARSFQVPFLLLLALGGYLVLQRGFGRGSLPMAATDLPLSVDPGPEAGADDVRYVL